MAKYTFSAFKRWKKIKKDDHKKTKVVIKNLSLPHYVIDEINISLQC